MPKNHAMSNPRDYESRDNARFINRRLSLTYSRASAVATLSSPSRTVTIGEKSETLSPQLRPGSDHSIKKKIIFGAAVKNTTACAHTRTSALAPLR